MNAEQKKIVSSLCKTDIAVMFFSLAWVLFFAGKIFIDPANLLHLYKLKDQHIELKRLNEQISTENKKFAHEIHLLESDERYITKTAREEYGFIRADEIIVEIPKEADTN